MPNNLPLQQSRNDFLSDVELTGGNSEDAIYVRHNNDLSSIVVKKFSSDLDRAVSNIKK